MVDLLISYATLLSYIAFSAELLFQIVRVAKRKSSADVSAGGTAIRLTGSCIILLKFLTLRDPYLLIGQTVLIITATVYFALVLRYRNPAPQPGA